MSALSNIIQVGTSLPKTLGVQCSHSIDALLVGREKQLVLGESTSLVTAGMKFYSKVGYGKDLYGYEIPLPQTELEKYLGARAAQTAFNVFGNSRTTTSIERRQLLNEGGTGTSTSSLYSYASLSSSQTTTNYLTLQANTTIIKLKIGYDGMLNDSTTTITMPTVGQITYSALQSVNGTVHCGLNSSSYDVALNCSLDPSLVVKCPGNITTDISYTCPGYSVVPECLAWVQQLADFAVVPECVVVQYDSNQTVCQCTGPTGYGDSEDDGGHVSYSNELAASAQIITSAFTNTILHTKVDASTLAKNPVRHPSFVFIS